MGFLHKLWDETLAGPTPETGLGKLRKYDSFSASTTRSRPAVVEPDDVVITRSITILKRHNSSNNYSSFRNCSLADPGSAPDSPAGPSTPRTPSTPGTPPGDFKRFTRRKSSAEALDPTAREPTSPTIYDWVVISALDR